MHHLITTILAISTLTSLCVGADTPASITTPIPWSQFPAEKCKLEIEKALARAETVVQQILARDNAEMTFDNTWFALEEAQRQLGLASAVLNHQSNTMDSPALRATMEEMEPRIATFSSNLELNVPLYLKLKVFCQDTAQMSTLDSAQKRLIQVYMEAFELNGIRLPAEKQEQLKQIDLRLTELATQFRKIRMDSVNAWSYSVTDPTMLAGLPPSAQAEAKNDAIATGVDVVATPTWLFSLNSNTPQQVLTYAHNPELRRKIKEGLNSVNSGKYDTAHIVLEMTKLRQEQASILGYPSYFDYTTSNRMAQNAKTVEEMEESMFGYAKSYFDQENQELLQFANEHKLVPDTPVTTLHPADRAYVTNKYRQAKLSFNPALLLEYFPQDQVLKGMLAHISEMFDVTITQTRTWCHDGVSATEPAPDVVETWHPDVVCLEIRDNADGKLLGRIFCDFYTRKGKRKGGWAAPFPTATGEPRCTLIVCNLNRPTDQTKPAMFSHRDVTTIFHEMGHAFHNMFSVSPYSSLGGTRVVRDFVEFPSRVFENWAHEPEVLRATSRHQTTGKPLPQELIDKMEVAHKFMPGTTLLGKLRISKIDRIHHIHNALKDPTKLDEQESTIMASYYTPSVEKEPAVSRQLNHLFGNAGGYAGSYYSYLWGEILEADAANYIRLAHRSGDKTIGPRLRKCILSQGNLKPPQELYQDFMGRAATPDAFYERLGLPTPVKD